MMLQLKAAIDQVSDATQEEKDAAKAKVDEEVTKAKSIDKATQIMMLTKQNEWNYNNFFNRTRSY